MSASIIIKNLEQSFGNNKVINKFNIKINDGEFSCISWSIWLWKVYTC